MLDVVRAPIPGRSGTAPRPEARSPPGGLERVEEGPYLELRSTLARRACRSSAPPRALVGGASAERSAAGRDLLPVESGSGGVARPRWPLEMGASLDTFAADRRRTRRRRRASRPGRAGRSSRLRSSARGRNPRNRDVARGWAYRSPRWRMDAGPFMKFQARSGLSLTPHTQAPAARSWSTGRSRVGAASRSLAAGR